MVNEIHISAGDFFPQHSAVGALSLYIYKNQKKTHVQPTLILIVSRLIGHRCICLCLCHMHMLMPNEPYWLWPPTHQPPGWAWTKLQVHVSNRQSHWHRYVSRSIQNLRPNPPNRFQKRPLGARNIWKSHRVSQNIQQSIQGFKRDP